MEIMDGRIGHDVIVTGLPSTMNQLKIKLFFQRKVNCKVKVSRISDRTVGLVFDDDKELRNFVAADIKEVPFGNESYKLQYLKIPSNIGNPDKSYAEQNMIFQKVHCWTDLKELPAPGGSRCVLVQNIDPSSSLQVVQMHFESRRRSGGGPVKTIIRMPDGILVVFNDPNNCVSCVNTSDQTIDQNKLQILGKTIPAYYERKFIIEGVREGTTEEHLKMFLERCTKNEISPISCIRHSRPGVFLVEYDEEFDVEETSGFLKKVSQEPLEEHKLNASRLLQSDCIKVVGVPSTASDDKIKMTLESKKRADGGPVTKVNRLKSGSLLVYFENFEDAERIASRFKMPSSHAVEIDEQVLTIQLYHHALSKDHDEQTDMKVSETELLMGGCDADSNDDVPDQSTKTQLMMYYDRMLVIEGVSESTVAGDLMMYLESCSDKETSPISCRKQSSPGVYVIEYDDELELAEINNLLKKVSLKRLGGNKLQASRLLRSRCLKVIGVPVTTSEERITMTFESKRRTDGGPVAKVDRLQNGSVLVYFTNETDAERIYNRFKLSSNEPLEIDDKDITIELYHHLLLKNPIKEQKSCQKDSSISDKLLKNSIEDQKISLKGDVQSTSADLKEYVKEIEFKPACSEKVFFFLRGNPTHHKSLSGIFEDLAKVELCGSTEENCIIKFALLQDVPLHDQGAYEKNLLNLFEDFVKAYCSKSKSLENKKLQKVASLKLHPLLENFPCDVINDDFIVRWKHNTVVVTGLKDAVENAMSSIEKCMEYQTAQIPVNEKEYKIMKVCGIVEHLQEEFDKVVIACDDEKHTITVDGTEDDKNAILLKATTLRNTVKQRSILGLNEDIDRYLSENAAALQHRLQDHITGRNIKAIFGFKEEKLHVLSQNVGEHMKVIDAIKSLIAVETVPVTGIKVDVVGSNQWQDFENEMRRNGNCSIHLKNDKSILVVGFHSDVRTIRTRIDTFLNENVVKRIVIPMSYGEARFILERSKLFEARSKKRKALKSCGLTYEQGGGIYLQGKPKSIEEARIKINSVRDSVVQKKHARTDPGLKQYYLKASGKKILETIGRLNNCVVLADSAECSEWERLNQGKTAGPSNAKPKQKEALVSAQLGKVKLSVWKVDILQHCCDVIINTSNTDFKLMASGVSGAIQKYDVRNANKIQCEMDEITKQISGNISSGDAFITGPGNLPCCKKIVHVVGPRVNVASQNSAESLQTLEACVKKTLEKTEEAKLVSIAIPAISCGAFGGEPETKIPVILNAVTEYFQQHQSSCITQVDFVEMSNDKVLQEFVKAVSIVDQRVPLKPKPVPRASTSNSSKRSSVSLVCGDIVQLKVPVDVIVNIMAEGHIKDMTQGSVIAKVVAAAAGPTVVSECAKNAGKYTAGSVFTTDAGKLSCKKIYHGLIESYGQNSEERVKKIVQECIQMATQSNYKSIAFPAIGTGKFNHPPDKVAEWMKEAIKKYLSNDLCVSIVLHPSNPPVSFAFNHEFHGLPGRSSLLSSSVKYGPLTVSVMQGDITQQGTDAIVNSAHSSFDLSRAGMISSAILHKGGSGIQDELKNATGEIAVTSGGNLPCKHIIHLATPKNEKHLEKQLVTVLTKANELKLSSIAIPALATGNIQMSASTVGSIIRSAIEAFTQLNQKSLHISKVDVVIFDVTLIQDFRDAIIGDIAPSKSVVQNAFKGLYNWLFKTRTIQVAQEKLDIYFYAGSAKDIEKALAAIDSESAKVLLNETIEDKAIALMTSREEAEIEQIKKNDNVKIEYKDDKLRKHILVTGLSIHVRKACDSIRAILREINDAINCVRYIAWELLDANGQWVGIPARVAHDLEKAYQIQKGGNLGPVQVDEYSSQYNKMIKQTYDLSTLGKNDAQIRRRLKVDDTLPPFWDNMDGIGLKQVALKPDSAEYKEVLNKFQASGLNPTIVAVITCFL